MSLHRKLWADLSALWANDRAFSLFLVLLVVKAFVLPALAIVGAPGRLLGDIFFSLLLFAGVASVPRWRWVYHVLAGAVVVTLLVHWLSWLFRPDASVVVREWASLATLVTFTAVVLSKVMSTGSVTFARIEGAVAAYLLLGLCWASAYELVYLMHPLSFQGPIGEVTPGLAFSYYSFVTLTTVGYGDITPVHPIARSLAVTEALTGQLYVAILLARLVSLEVRSRKD